MDAQYVFLHLVVSLYSDRRLYLSVGLKSGLEYADNMLK